MDKNRILSDPNFDSKKISQYSCVLLVSNNSFAYKIVDTSNDKALFFEQQTFNTQLLLEDNRLEKKLQQASVNLTACSNIHVIVQNQNFSLIPKVLYSDENGALFLNSLTENNFHQEFLSNENRQLNLLVNFAIPKALHQYFLSKFKSVIFTHFCASLIKQINQAFDSRLKNQLFVDLNINKLTIVHFNDKGLNFCNIFEISNEEDFLYFLLATTEELGLQNNETKVILLGDIQLGDKKHHYAFNYFSKIQFGEIQSKSTTSFLNELPKHQFYSLLKETA